MIKNVIETNKAPNPVGAYPHAKKVGPFLYLSGIGPRTPGSNLIPEDFAEQCHSVFRNIQAIVSEAKYAWEDLVDVTVFLTNMSEQFQIFNKIYAEYFPHADSRPCRTTVEVRSLPTPISVELKCIAYKEN